MSQHKSNSSLERYAEIARFWWKYRNAGVFLPEASLAAAMAHASDASPSEEGKAEDFAKDLEAMGPAFVKIGQSLSTRPDLIAPVFIKSLEKMQDQCAPVDFSRIRTIIEEELNVRLTDVFAEIDEKPIASASLGQVHRARLNDGSEVAVKVQRPDAMSEVIGDLTILAQLAAKVDDHSDTGRHYGFSQWVVQLRQSIMRELNYELEANNLKTFAGILEEYPDIVVPQPFWNLTSQRVLVMDFVHGIKVQDKSGTQSTEGNGTAMAEQLTEAYLDQMFVHGFVHVDPHPGNILITEEGKLSVLDLGMVAHLSPRLRHQVLSLILAIVDGRGDEAAERAIEMGQALKDFDRVTMVRDVSQLVSEYNAGAGTVGEGLLMLNMTRVAADHGLQPPPEIILLGKTLLNLEFLCQELAPDMDMRNVVHKHLGKIIRHRAWEQLKPSNIASSMLDLSNVAQEMPRQLSHLLTQLVENRLTIRVDAFDENLFAANFQKVANRVAVGLIVAALIIAAALLMHIETEPMLWGYPAFAAIFFLFAGLLGVGLVISVLWTDLRQKRKR